MSPIIWCNYLLLLVFSITTSIANSHDWTFSEGHHMLSLYSDSTINIETNVPTSPHILPIVTMGGWVKLSMSDSSIPNDIR